ncbi:signal transduction histidine kinase [Asanoa ferruginea]|uniref:histidine kinase n=1 Tax=Asanoa ferruginea TaxID=53367 RepID=A0A3D9ZV21_9ACTN|nr:HAMP domain-containing sensor histidine kinase [Asanoa ferruginea]REG00820.1 signal transduction histidine kinase [Asanoa ferruginea]GIF47305.1 sensor protein CutS [Asanoa ferruginea]
MRPRFTVRVRLTLLYTGLFAACGAIVVGVTYAMLAANLPDPVAAGDKPNDTTVMVQGVPKTQLAREFFDENCQKVLKDEPDVTLLKNKCEAAYKEGIIEGAKNQRAATLDRLLWYSLSTLAGVTLLAAVAGWIVAGRVLRPVHRITAAARDASEHHLAARVALTGPRDELRELADTFDAMLDRLQAAFEGQRRFIANAGHELRTPLTVMRATVDVVLAKPAPTNDELQAMGRDVRAAVDHAEALIEALLTLARTDRGLVGRDPVDLATILEDAVDAAPGAAPTARLHTSLAPAPATGDPILLERLAANLYDNAMRYNVPGGEVWLTTATVDGRAVLTVANTGPTIPPDAVGGLFQPFRRLRDRTGDGGFGLGLAIVASIATAHGGSAVADAPPDGGLSVTVSLPARLPDGAR